MTGVTDANPESLSDDEKVQAIMSLDAQLALLGVTELDMRCAKSWGKTAEQIRRHIDVELVDMVWHRRGLLKLAKSGRPHMFQLVYNPTGSSGC